MNHYIVYLGGVALLIQIKTQNSMKTCTVLRYYHTNEFVIHLCKYKSSMKIGEKL